ncbi:MAG: hypothetical protein JWP89_2597 [Schlesneria sp.]|nr:hypothetical protein [Schlesneria sp.]
MNSVLLKPQAKQLFEVHAQQSHPKLSLRRVLWSKILRWVDKASPQALWKTSARGLCVLLIAAGVLVPQFTLGILTSAAQWNGYRIPLFLGLLAFTLNIRRLVRLIRRRKHGANQHTYHGLPVGEFASWLKTNNAFKRDESIRTFGLSQGQWLSIATELEKHSVLMRGENNARVLRQISLENLVRQLRDNFPLVWSEDRQVWAERNGTFERWAMTQDFKTRKLEEQTAKKERKLDRLKQQISEHASMADVLALCR